MARRCGAKHICKSKCTKHHIRGAILEVPMLKNGTRLWREAHVQVKMHKTPHSRSHFGSSDVEIWHAAVARSTCSSQNAQNTPFAEPFWKFRCSKMARGCGAKHIFKSKCTKHHNLGPILEVPMFKNGTRLWREAHFKSKCGKTDGYGPLFGGLMSKNCTPLWREAHLQVKMFKTPAFCSILRRF